MARHVIKDMFESGPAGVEFTTLSQNRLDGKLEEGTRCASVVLSWPDYRWGVNTETEARMRTETEARRRVVQQWCAKWGPVPWDLASIKITHVTMQVVLELRVMPLG